MKKQTLAIATTALLLIGVSSTAAAAPGNLPYTYIDAAATHASTGADSELNGLSLDGSLRLKRHLTGLAGASKSHGNDHGHNVDSKGWYVGMGSMVAVGQSSRIHLMVSGKYEAGRLDVAGVPTLAPGAPIDVRSTAVEGGARIGLTKRVEAYGFVGSRHYDSVRISHQGRPSTLLSPAEGKSMSYQRAGAAVRISRRFSLTGEVVHNDWLTSYGIGVRVSI